MKQELLQQLESNLKTEKARLEEELKNFASEDKDMKGNWKAKHPGKGQEGGDLEEEADETKEYENRISLEHSLEIKLRDVNAALEKIIKGTYGTCEKCGAKIEEERLMAYPEAKTCQEHNK